MPGHRVQNDLETAKMSSTFKGFITPEGACFGIGAGVPTDGEVDWAPSAIYINTLGTGFDIYKNTGTSTSSTWTELGSGSTSIINANATLNDAAGLDATLAITNQTSSKPVLTIPDMAGTSTSFAFLGIAQTWSGNQTFGQTNLILKGGDTNACTIKINETLTGAKTLNVKINDTSRTIDLSGNLTLAGAFTTGGAWTHTGAHAVTLVTAGATDLDLPVGGAGFEVCAYDASAAAQGELPFIGTGAIPKLLGVGTTGQALISGGAAADVSWGTPNVANATSLANTLTCEAGATDYTLDFGTAGGAYTLTIPAVGGARTFSFINQAETISANKTFGQTNLILQGGDANACTIKIDETLTGAKTLGIKINDTTREINLAGNIALGGTLTTLGAWTQTGAHTLGLTTTNNTALTLPVSGTLATLAGSEALSNKTYEGMTITSSTGTITLTNGKTLTVQETITLTAGAASQTFTLPTVTDTIVGRASTDSLTNKTLDCNGTGNVVTNVNGAEVEAVTMPSAGDASDTVIGVPFTIVAFISNQGAAVNIYNANAPFAFVVKKAYSINASADGGTWKLNDGAGGAGTDITNAVTVAASDQDYDEPTDYDDSVTPIAANGSLSIVPDVGGLLDAYIYIECIRGA